MFKALIWDCDGCLLDSEHIACSLAARLFTEAGYSITTDDFIRRFCGQGKTHIFNTIQSECGIDYRPHLESLNKRSLQREAFRLHLKPIPGIEEALEKITLPMAIASGSDYDRLEYTLQLAGLFERFRSKIFDPSCVTHGKPAPDLFLYAAKQLQIAPASCLVIEDSLNGVRAGKAAGMTVFGFAGGSHILDKPGHKQELLNLGAKLVFDNMTDLPHLMLTHSFNS